MFKDMHLRLLTIGHFCAMGGLCGVLLMTKMVSASLLFWILLGTFVISASREWRQKTLPRFPKFFWRGMVFMALWTLCIALLFHHKGWGAVLVGIASAVTTDYCAYMWGNLLGGPKLCPAISHKKTWTGFILSLLSTWVIFSWIIPVVGLSSYVPQYPHGCYLMMGVCAHMGDLGESFLKRHMGIKDMGDVFPGHGGILDRTDSWFGTLLFLALLSMVV